MIRAIAAFLLAVLLSQSCFAWSENGHHLIAVMAFEELTSDEQSTVLEILKAHPRLMEDFGTPDKAGKVEHFLIGRSACWPDIVKKTPNDRPTWHYQLGSALTIGDVPNVPENPGSCPPDATMDTQDLYIVQASELCLKVLKDTSLPTSDRAIALCWIGNLIGEAHQPCHSGCLYAPAFPEGDKRGFLIPTRQSKNLYALWEGLLGLKFDASDVKRRAREIRTSTALWSAAKLEAQDTNPMVPQTWLKESSHHARSSVYTAEILNPVKKLKPGEKLLELHLSTEYLRKADVVAKQRAAVAALRLAAIFREVSLAKAE